MARDRIKFMLVLTCVCLIVFGSCNHHNIPSGWIQPHFKVEPALPQKHDVRTRTICRYSLRDSASASGDLNDSIAESYTASGLLSERFMHVYGSVLWVFYKYDTKGRMITDSTVKAPSGKSVSHYTYNDRKGILSAVTYFADGDSTNVTMYCFHKGILTYEVRLDRKSDTVYSYLREADHSVATWYYYNAVKGQPLRRQRSEVIFYEQSGKKRTYYNFSATGESSGPPAQTETYNSRGQLTSGLIYQSNGYPEYVGNTVYDSHGVLKETSSVSYGVDGKAEHSVRSVYTYEGIHLVRADHFRDEEKLPRDVDYYQYANGLLSKILSRQLKNADDPSGVNWTCRTFTYKFYQ